MPDSSQAESEEDKALLSNDFVVMIDCLPELGEAFCESSDDYELAWLWLNKLTTFECSTIYELRMRNAFMSHFSVCLNQKRLTGVFRQPPPEVLEWVDFQDDSSQEQVARACRLATCCGMQTAPNTMQMSFDEAPRAREAPCCSRSQSSHAAAARSPSHCSCGSQNSPEKAYYHSNGGRYSAGHSAATSPGFGDPGSSTSEEEFSRKASGYTQPDSPSSYRSRSSPPKPSSRSEPASKSFSKEDVSHLLQLIRGELSGEPNSKRNDFLEQQLRRYRDFYALNKHKDPDFDAPVAGDPKSERNILLLNMQKDLIKLLFE
ncbi:uncharacterized protein Dana_GF27076 [Drosophila ananassae]|uniref:DUF4485 domain-containing protein n=1 Tax=Drosophila ananassae TaxID=7217 RepID=A0A0P8XSD5_DROAN|nr:uncharacterized protein LOC26514485 [Drosophila ananassae]KPU77590.1 uncharacterized protein Dana_GF27076 [Drosophila ananassae]